MTRCAPPICVAICRTVANYTTTPLLLDKHYSDNKKGARCGAKEKLTIDVTNEKK
jgi:hypothetical protein